MNFTMLQDKIRTGKKRLTYRQLYVPQVTVGNTEPLWDSKNKRKVKKKSGKGYKEVKTLLAKGKVTDVYFRLKTNLTLEECCLEQGREIPALPDGFNIKYPNIARFANMKHKELTHLLNKVKDTLNYQYKNYFPLLWRIQSALTIIKKSWRILTKLNSGNKPNGIIIRWDHIHVDPPPKINTITNYV